VVAADQILQDGLFDDLLEEDPHEAVLLEPFAVHAEDRRAPG
jgi:hypothetical protein